MRKRKWPQKISQKKMLQLRRYALYIGMLISKAYDIDAMSTCIAYLELLQQLFEDNPALRKACPELEELFNKVDEEILLGLSPDLRKEYGIPS